MDAEEANIRLLDFVYFAVDQCEVCWAFGKAHRLAVAGASSVSSFCGKLQGDLLFLGDVVALRAMDVRTTVPLPARVRPESPHGSSGTVLGQPPTKRMRAGGEARNEIRADLCAERIIRLHLQGEGVHPLFFGEPEWVGARSVGFGSARF